MLYLHAGFHKTGTTSIQTTLFSHREKLRSFGVGYFDHSSNHSVPLQCAFTPRGPRHPEIVRKRFSPADVEGFAHQTRQALSLFLADTSHAVKIVSAESVSNFCPEELVCFKSFVGKFPLKLRIIFYVRNYFDYLSSQIQELVRWGDSLASLRDNVASGGLKPCFGSTVATFAEHFGAENIEVRLLHRDRLVGGDLLHDFCTAIGHPDIFAQLEQRRMNVSMSDASTYLMSDYNALFPLVVDGAHNWHRADRAAAHFAKDDGSKYRFVDESALASFAARAATDVAMLEPFLDASARALLTEPGPADSALAKEARSKTTHEHAIQKLGETLVKLDDAEAILEIAILLLRDKSAGSHARIRTLVQTSLPKLRSNALCHRFARTLLAAGRPGLAEIAAKRACELDRQSERHAKLAADVAKVLARHKQRAT